MTERRAWIAFLVTGSLIVAALVTVVMMLGEGAESPAAGASGGWLSMSRRPMLHATLNATSAVLLTVGYLFIRVGRRQAHLACMLTATAVNGLFLVSYLQYHARVGSIPFTGEGWSRPVYFAILITHAVLAAVVVPLALAVLWAALNGRFPRHRQVARWTLPIWLYVSVTGVLVYLFAHVWFTSS